MHKWMNVLVALLMDIGLFGLQVQCGGGGGGKGSGGGSNGATAPTFTTQPQSQTVTAPAPATFKVVANGNPTPTYQWNLNGVAITGATSSSYTTPATTFSMNGGSYTCTITNSVTSLISNAAVLTISINFSDQSLNGTYAGIHYDSNFGALTQANFDGNGNISGSGIQNHLGTISNITVSGTYSVAPDGTLTINSSGAILTGKIRSDTNTIIFGEYGAGENNEVDVSIKINDSGYSNSSLNGTYAGIHYDSSFGALTQANFDGNGNISGSGIQNHLGTISNITVSGTYSVAPDGTLTINSSGAILTGKISSDTNTIIFGEYESGENNEVDVSIKITGSGYSISSLNGTYSGIHYDSSFGSLTQANFDGNGNISGSGIQNYLGTISNITVSGTYSVAPDGTLTINSSGAILTGKISSDTNTIIFGEYISRKNNEVDVSIKCKY